MSGKLFTVYKSSAGSGKTYTLTRSYLILALQFPDKFKKILAVTFTNKATQEMKDRILATLSAFKNGNTKGMGHEIMSILSVNEPTLIARASDLLAQVLHNYTRFSVQTIDTFFQSVMRAFSRELGVSGDGELLLDSTEAREQAIDLLLEDLDTNQTLRDWLIEFASDKVENAKSWDIRKDILDFSRHLFREDFLKIEQQLFHTIADSNTILSYTKKILVVTNQFESAMAKIGEETLVFINGHGLAYDDFSHGKTSAVNYFNKIRQADFDPGKRVYETLMTNGAKLAAKTSKKKAEIAAAVDAGLLDYFEKAIALYERDYKKYITAKLIANNLYNLGILWLFREKLLAYKKEEGISFINDATLFLNKLIDEEETPFIYEKIGAFYEHFLIDEFQDTSAFQWNNFKPLINNALDQGKKSLVVGDVKQGIYRWRGGDLNLLLHQIKSDVRSHAYGELNLDKNYRSKPYIIDFNNHVFAELSKSLQQQLNGKIDEDTMSNMTNVITDAYKEVYQHKTGTYETDGFVEVAFFEHVKEDEEKQWKQNALIKLVKDLEQLQDAGYKLSEIAILVRKAAHGREINEFLLRQQRDRSSYRFDVISNESLFISASLLVTFILNCLRYLYSPNDRVALAQLIYYYQKIILKSHADVHALFSACTERNDNNELLNLLPEPFISERSRLLNMSLLDITEKLIQYFNLDTQKDDLPYLQAFQDMLLNYGSQGDVKDFLDWWEINQDNFKLKIPESADAIRMITIHKSKGLQYRVVLIPFLDWPVNHGTKVPMLWAKADGLDFFGDIPYLPVKHTKDLQQSYFAKAYWQEETKAYLDNLNLLYVALTRAEDVLIVSAKQNAGDSEIASALKHVLKATDNWDEEESLFRKGDMVKATRQDKDDKEGAELIALTHYKSVNWAEKLEIRKGKALKLSEHKLKTRKKINLGLLVHEVFSKMKKLDDKEEALKELRNENALSAEELAELTQLVNSSLTKNSALARWFTTDWEVRTEVPIIDPEGNDMRIDRVHLKGDEARVLDFKTGVEKTADIEQVEAYKNVLSRMGYNKVEGYLAYVNLSKIVKV